ncbi:MAG: NAD(P)-dependent oxidoreductase [Azospirillaceae bacterium]
MLPLIVDPARVAIALIGQGDAFDKRLAMLREAGAEGVHIFTADPDPDLAAAPDLELTIGWPDAETLRRFHIVYVVGLPYALSSALEAAARAGGALVNVEDMNDLCAFHVPARIHRGDLLITVSTGGRSPGLAVRLKRWIAERIGGEWAERLDALADERARWREAGAGMTERLVLTEALIDREGWLDRDDGRQRAAEG